MAAKEYFYELAPVEAGARCIHCTYPIHGPNAIWFAKDVPGPFCRPECALKYHGLKGKMRRSK